MSLFFYLLVMGVWVALVEAALHRWRSGEYRRIAEARDEAEELLREARVARLRAYAQPQPQRRAS